MKKNKYVNHIEKKEDEIELYYEIRKIFIDTQKPKTLKQFKLANMYSNVLINMLFLQCKYQTKTEKRIKDFLSKNYNKIEKLVVNNQM